MAQQFFNNTGGRQQLQPQAGMGMPAYIPSVELDRNSPFRMEQAPNEPAQAFRGQGWATEFGTSSSPQQRASPAPGPQSSQMISQLQRSYYQPQTYGYGTSPYSQSYSPNYLSQPTVTADVKGKGKLTEAEFDAAFASFDQEGLGGLEEALEKTSLEDKGKGKARGDDVVDFERVWNNLRESEVPPPQSEMAKWEAEFNQMMNGQRDEMDFTAEMEEQYKNLAREDGEGLYGMGVEFDENGIPKLGEYVFETQNPFLDHPSPLSAAKDLLASNGSLSETSLLLESAIQQSDLGKGGYEAWILLGETHSMDEKEESAIRALQTGVEIASRSNEGLSERERVGGKRNVDGMVSLAIAYTNESYEKASYVMLARWLAGFHPDLCLIRGIDFDHPNGLGGDGNNLSTWALKEKVTECFLEVARIQHRSGVVDPDVQIGLGVLLYTGGDYERAADCFQSALQVRPNDYLLWNRYGSCLSNNNRPEEALGVYREALNIRPTYTRAIFNVGVACLNIGAHKEAAEHLLSGLDHQIRAGNSTSEQLWTTLRRCLIVMDRADLAELARPGTSLDTFRNFGFEF